MEETKNRFMSVVYQLYSLKDGKSELFVGVGCTGGRHRSVYCAETISKMLGERGIKCIISHRDIDKEPHRYTKKAEED